MKKVTFALLACLFLLSCDKDNDQAQPLIELSQTSCELGDDNPYILVKVTGEADSYTVSSADIVIAKVIRTLYSNEFFILANEVGKTIITVSDKNNNKSTVDVNVTTKVRDRVPVREKVFIKKDDTKTIDFPHPISMISQTNTHQSIASVSTSDLGGIKKMTINGYNIGETQVSIYELNWASFVFDIKVVDSYYLKLGSGDIEASFYNRPYYIYILSGNGNYTVESADQSVATCELQPYDGDLSNFSTSNPAKVKIMPHKAGASTQITVTDKDKKSKTIKFSTSFFYDIND